MKLHYKGYLLGALHQANSQWSDALIAQTLQAYDEVGAYRENSLRIALDELAAAGLIHIVEQKIAVNQASRLLFKYQLADFGRSRMQDTGLLV